jgi:hypothetical protein
MPEKTLVRKASAPNKYVVIHPNHAPQSVDAEEQQVKKILDEAEAKLKAVFDPNPILASGVKLGLVELL